MRREIVDKAMARLGQTPEYDVEGLEALVQKMVVHDTFEALPKPVRAFGKGKNATYLRRGHMKVKIREGVYFYAHDCFLGSRPSGVAFQPGKALAGLLAKWDKARCRERDTRILLRQILASVTTVARAKKALPELEDIISQVTGCGDLPCSVAESATRLNKALRKAKK